GNELDLRVLTLPVDIDPCDFLLREGGSAFTALAERAPNPLAYVLDRASARFDLESIDGSSRAAEWVLGILNSVPSTHRLGLEVKQAKVMDTLSHRLRIPLEALTRLRRKLRRPSASLRSAGDRKGGVNPTTARSPSIRPAELDRTDLELLQI